MRENWHRKFAEIVYIDCTAGYNVSMSNNPTTLPFNAADVADALRDAVVLLSGTGRDANPHEIAELASNTDGAFTLLVANDEATDAITHLLVFVGARDSDLAVQLSWAAQIQAQGRYAVSIAFPGFTLAE